MKLTREQIGYIAGIIDGEGHVCLIHRKSDGLYFPTIRVTNSNLDMILWLKSKLGGSIAKQKPMKQEHKIVYRITFSADMIRSFLPFVIDSLIVKRSQALLLLEYLKRVGKCMNINPEKKRCYYNGMRALNFRGLKKGGEFGGNLTSKAEGNTEPSRRIKSLGVCNDYGLPPKGMI